MRDDRDYKVELSSNPQPADQPTAASKPFLSVHFACCNVYNRVYRSPDRKTYRGRCPRCARTITFTVGEGGTDSRVFRVS